MKSVRLFAAAALMTVLLSTTALAGNWIQDSVGWWWDNGDGTYPRSEWAWLDGNRDGKAECYYFDARGYCLLNTTTPDGYQVNADGAWIENGQVQVRDLTPASPAAQAAATAERTLTQEQKNYILGMLQPMFADSGLPISFSIEGNTFIIAYWFNFPIPASEMIPICQNAASTAAPEMAQSMRELSQLMGVNVTCAMHFYNQGALIYASNI